jgi:hypothetical protein
MRDELERIWKEAVVAEWGYYPGIYIERLRKIAIPQPGEQVFLPRFEPSAFRIRVSRDNSIATSSVRRNKVAM